MWSMSAALNRLSVFLLVKQSYGWPFTSSEYSSLFHPSLSKVIVVFYGEFLTYWLHTLSWPR